MNLGNLIHFCEGAVANDVKLQKVVDHLELSMIDLTLKKTRGNKSQAAKLLGISRAGLLEKIKKYDLKEWIKNEL